MTLRHVHTASHPCTYAPTHTLRSKAKYAEAAKAAGVPAIISSGIYPGTSNVMAAHIISIARKEYDEDWKYRQPEAGNLWKEKHRAYYSFHLSF